MNWDLLRDLMRPVVFAATFFMIGLRAAPAMPPSSRLRSLVLVAFGILVVCFVVVTTISFS